MKCTSWFSVPSLLIYLDIVKVLNVKNTIYINKIIFGGEGYPKPKLKKVSIFMKIELTFIMSTDLQKELVFVQVIRFHL